MNVSQDSIREGAFRSGLRGQVPCIQIVGGIRLGPHKLNLDRGGWAIAGEVIKNGDPHVVPLTPETVEILRGRREMADLAAAARRQAKVVQAPKKSEQFVFASEQSGPGHVTDCSSAWHRLLKTTDMENFIPHDLRRTNGSWQARIGSSLLPIGKSLAHRTAEATEIYARLDLDPVRASVETATSAMLDAADVKVAAEVIPMRPGVTGDARVTRSGGKK